MSIFDLFKKKSNPVPEGLVSSLAKNEIVMSVDTDAGAVPPQASKIGGKPWLPRDFQWPVYESDEMRSLSFLCQINLGRSEVLRSGRRVAQQGYAVFLL